jgi:hypothetical protein
MSDRVTVIDYGNMCSPRSRELGVYIPILNSNLVTKNNFSVRPPRPAAVETGRFLSVDPFGEGATSFRKSGNKTKLKVLILFILNQAD